MTFLGFPNSVSQSFVTASSNGLVEWQQGSFAAKSNQATETIWKWNQRDLSQFDLFIASGTLPPTSYSLSVVSTSNDNANGSSTALRMTLTGALPGCLILLKPKNLRVPSRHQVNLYYLSSSVVNVFGGNVRLGIVSFATDTTSSSNFTGFGITKNLSNSTGMTQTHYANGLKVYDISRAISFAIASTNQVLVQYMYAYNSASLQFDINSPFMQTNVNFFNYTTGNANSILIPHYSTSYSSSLETHEGSCVYFGYEVAAGVADANGYIDIGNIEVLSHPIDQRYINTYAANIFNV